MKHFLIIVLLFSLTRSIYAQTNVSGGIFQNTTWTVANSPYYMTGSVVVFPGKTLTIEPGVDIYVTADQTFNTSNFVYLEVRGNLVAEGTLNNRIRFLSTDTTTGFYNWTGIQLKGSQGGTASLNHFELHNSFYGIANDIAQPGISYNFTDCVFRSNNYGVSLNADMNYQDCKFLNNSIGQGAQLVCGSLTANNCEFKDNFCSFTWVYGSINVTNSIFENNSNTIIGVQGTISNCQFLDNDNAILDAGNLTITNCTFLNNNYGVNNVYQSTLHDNLFELNNVAIRIDDLSTVYGNKINNNSIGLQVGGAQPSSTNIFNNQICYNSNFNLENLTDKNFSLTANCFCSSDSTTLENLIYDGYDDITRGLVNYAIYDDSCQNILSYVTKIQLDGTATLDEENKEIEKWWYANGSLYLLLTEDSEIEIFDASGRKILEQRVSEGTQKLTLNLNSGLFFVRSESGATLKIVN